MLTDEPDPRTNAFLRVLRGLLRPLVKAMIARGVTAPAVYRLLKEIYVDVADADFRLDNRRPTDSRISVLTGVHRKDVRSIRDQSGPGETTLRRRVTAIASVIGRWLADPSTRDGDGQPLALPRQAERGPSFDALVESVSKDIRPRTVLDELVRQRLVEIDAETDTVHLRTEAFLGPGDAEQKVLFFAQNVGDHIAAATENLLAENDPAPFMERAVFYNRLLPGSVDAIEGLARDRAGALLGELNRVAFERQSDDKDALDASERFRFGVYFYRTEDEAEPSETEPEAPSADGPEDAPPGDPAGDDPEEHGAARGGRTSGDGPDTTGGAE
ncbi:MAG: DUF6502 family protein [Paracoccaceae bacterium]